MSRSQYPLQNTYFIAIGRVISELKKKLFENEKNNVQQIGIYKDLTTITN